MEDKEYKEFLERIKKAIIDGNKEESASLAQKAVAEKLNLLEVIEKGFVPGIQTAGELWEKGEFFLPELITSAECMKTSMDIFEPALRKAKLETKNKGKIIIGTVEGDIHDIGKNLVASLLSANGFSVIDLGADVKLERFLNRALEEDAQFICLSALLTTTMLGQRKLIQMAIERNIRIRFKILVGGAPVTQRWADEIGADGYAENAMAAVRLVNGLLLKEGIWQ